MLAYGFAYTFAHIIRPFFPKTVVLQTEDALGLLVVILITSILASFTGIKTAISTNPTSAIGG
jgi:hypothetical protein